MYRSCEKVYIKNRFSSIAATVFFSAHVMWVPGPWPGTRIPGTLLIMAPKITGKSVMRGRITHLLVSIMPRVHNNQECDILPLCKMAFFGHLLRFTEWAEKKTAYPVEFPRPRAFDPYKQHSVYKMKIFFKNQKRKPHFPSKTFSCQMLPAFQGVRWPIWEEIHWLADSFRGRWLVHFFLQ